MKLLAWLSRLMFMAMFIAAVSVMTTWVIVDMYAERILQKFHLHDIYAAVQPGHMWGHMVGLWRNGDEKTPANISEGPTDERTPAVAGESTTEKSPADAGDSTVDEMAPDRPDAESEFPADALPVWGQASAGQRTLDADQNQQRERLDSLIMTAEEFNRKKDEMSEEDKMTIFTLLIPKVSQDELMRLSLLLEDGLTAEELSELHAMIDRHLDEDEWNELMSILDRY